jgi:pyruvate,water dikinase
VDRCDGWGNHHVQVTAAIVSRELGLPAIVDAGNATQILHDEQLITVSCAEGDEGFVYGTGRRSRQRKSTLQGFPRPAHR